MKISSNSLKNNRSNRQRKYTGKMNSIDKDIMKQKVSSNISSRYIPKNWPRPIYKPGRSKPSPNSSKLGSGNLTYQKNIAFQSSYQPTIRNSRFQRSLDLRSPKNKKIESHSIRALKNFSKNNPNTIETISNCLEHTKPNKKSIHLSREKLRQKLKKNQKNYLKKCIKKDIEKVKRDWKNLDKDSQISSYKSPHKYLNKPLYESFNKSFGKNFFV